MSSQADSLIEWFRISPVVGGLTFDARASERRQEAGARDQRRTNSHALLTPAVVGIAALTR
jgi:hypothetical protein